MRLTVGDKLGQYEILSPLGAGGMGEVYRARDLELGRDVALKVLPDLLARSPESAPRFQREAQALAALSHPGILTIFAFGSEGETTYAVSELLEGETLGVILERDGATSWRTTLEVGLAVSDGLAAAHDKGITHRDIKPDNLFVTSEGEFKILDFGLAKSMPLEPFTEDDRTLELPDSATMPGTLIGTVGYMSPEQAKGCPAGPPSDVFSLGCVLYEMLTGVRPFVRATRGETLAAVLGEDPDPFDPAAGIPPELQQIVLEALEKETEARFPTAAELRDRLGAFQQSLDSTADGTLLELVGRPRVAVPLVLLVLLAAALGIRSWQHAAARQRARQETLPEVSRLIATEEYAAAFALAREVERLIPDDTMLAGLWGETSNTISVVTDPPGADVFYRPNGAADADWALIGTSPIAAQRLPLGGFRLRTEKSGFEPRLLLSALSYPQQDGSFDGTASFSTPQERNSFHLRLDPVGTVPPGMVAVDGGGPYLAPLRGLPVEPVTIEPYFIDRTEVTNAAYKEFVDAGGYGNPEYWQEELRHEGRSVTREEAMARFVDATELPGPATWEMGDYPDGEGDHPVSGVSWYEAAAYAAFRGLTLPTVFHWVRAALPGNENVMPLGQEIIPLSNFGSGGTAPVGSYPGVGVSGAADLAGNVREWSWNASGNLRLALGGGWNEPTYRFSEAAPLDPFDRSEINGFRCMRERSGTTAEALRVSLDLPSYDFASIEPYTDEEFAVWTGLFWYDRSKPLDPRQEGTDESSEDWRRESVSIDAAYAGERFTIHMDFPRRGTPPYHAVVYFPGSNAWEQDTFEDTYWERFDYIPKDGRVLVRPVLAGTYERSGDGVRGRERAARIIKDLHRTIDYLETRDDIVADTVGYMGLSEGAFYAPIVLSSEKRFKAAVLIAGGLWGGTTVRFVSRVTTPLLLLAGRYDSEFPLETHQRPMIELLGTPEADRRHVTYEAGHLPLPRSEMIKETLAWLDRYQREGEPADTRRDSRSEAE
ncbi:MAG: protein kinase [Thermoanaerobaculia bacterium]